MDPAILRIDPPAAGARSTVVPSRSNWNDPPARQECYALSMSRLRTSRLSTRERIRARRRARQSGDAPDDDGFGSLQQAPTESEQTLLQLDAQKDFTDDDDDAPPSLLKSMFGWLKGKKKRPHDVTPSAAPVDDPVQRILSVPRGIARLDAFQETLQSLPSGTAGHRGVAMAFHRELTKLAEGAAMDLSLLKSRVQHCANALQEAGEAALAGALLAKIGKRYQAAQLFLEVGAIEELEAAHAAIRDEEGGERLAARKAYESFEGLFAVGLRKDALHALQEAAKLWPENPLYEEIKNRFFARLPQERFRLSFGRTTVDVCHRWPLTIGRGQEASLLVQSPLVSRVHLRLERGDGDDVLVVPAVETPGDVLVDALPLAGRSQPLRDSGLIDLRGVEIGYRRQGLQVELWTALRPDHRCMAPLGDELALDVKGSALRLLRRDGDLFVQEDPGVLVAGTPLERDLLLLLQDALAVGSTRVTVSSTS